MDISRCLAVSMKLPSGHIILIVNVYLPCSTGSCDYETEINECVGFIENCMVCNDYDSVLLLGDFNLECNAQSRGYQILSSFLRDYNLKCCDSLADPAIDYTYFQDILGRYSVIDHMFVNSDMFNNVINYSVVESGVNLSDHIPIRCVIAFMEPNNKYVQRDGSQTANKTVKHKRLRWDKGNIQHYYQKTGEMLQGLNIPYDLLAGQCTGLNCNHQARINNFYNDLINVLNYAALQTIPQITGDSIKPYWTEHLQQLKDDSIQIHRTWVDLGKPRNGVINKLRTCTRVLVPGKPGLGW